MKMQQFQHMYFKMPSHCLKFTRFCKERNKWKSTHSLLLDMSHAVHTPGADDSHEHHQSLWTGWHCSLVPAQYSGIQADIHVYEFDYYLSAFLCRNLATENWCGCDWTVTRTTTACYSNTYKGGAISDLINNNRKY